MAHLSSGVNKDFKQRKEHVLKRLSNMRTDRFQNIRVQFDQDSCVICLEQFEPDSEVCITNE